MKKLFELQQKITFLVNEYRVIKDDKLVAYARQKRLALREQFTLFSDETQKTVLATSKARKVIDFSPTFDVFDSSGKPLGVLQKEFKKSLLVSSWKIYDAQKEKELFEIREKNEGIAFLRRAWEFIPYLSEFLPFPIKFHFSITSNGKVVGEYEKLTLIRDHYALKLKEDQIPKLDERVWMVMAVLLDAMQSR